MTMVRRIALIADDLDRPGSPAAGARRALRRCLEADLPGVADAGRDSRFGRHWSLLLGDADGPAGCGRHHPGAWWTVGAGRVPGAVARWAGRFAHVFAARWDEVEAIRATGHASCHHLPVAVDPESHRKVAATPVRDVALIGDPGADGWGELADRLRAVDPGAAIGAVDLAEATRSSRIAVHHGRDGEVDARALAAMARGALLFTSSMRPDGPDALHLFDPGINLETFRDADELVRLVERYRGDLEAARRVAAFGRREVLANHTFDCRIRRVIEVLTYHRGHAIEADGYEAGAGVADRMVPCGGTRHG